MIRDCIRLVFLCWCALAATETAVAQQVSHPALRDELLAMAREDQQLRTRLETLYADTTKADALLKALHETEAVDSVNTARARAILQEHGWPGRSKVGADGAHAMWLLVQHADAHPEFQRAALTHLGRTVEAGEASGRDLAYLTDRVLLADGKPQRYGTQLTRVNGRLVVRPIEDSTGVNARRQRLGLPTLEAYLKQVEGNQ